MVIEIPLWWVGTAVWLACVGLSQYGSILILKTKNKHDRTTARISYLGIQTITIIIFLYGLSIGCYEVWSCPEIVRFV